MSTSDKVNAPMSFRKYGLKAKDGRWVEHLWFKREGIGCEMTDDLKKALAFDSEHDAVALQKSLPMGSAMWSVEGLPHSFDADELRDTLTTVLYGDARAKVFNGKPASNEDLFWKLNHIRLTAYNEGFSAGQAQVRRPLEPEDVKTQPVKPSTPCAHCAGKGTVKVAQNGTLVERQCAPCGGMGKRA